MIYCEHCHRMVAFRRRDYRIYCTECGQEITSSWKDESITKTQDSVSPKQYNNVSSKQYNSVSPKPVRTGTI